MALLYIKQVENNSLLGMWEMDAEVDNLANKTELNPSAELKTLKRKKEFITTRLLIDAMHTGAAIKYLPSGQPYLSTNDYHISISHSHNRVCILLNKTESVGIDIQFTTPKIARLKEKFLSTIELSALTVDSQLAALHIYWCAKEAMFKFFKEQFIDFRKHLAIQTFKVAQQGCLQGIISHPSRQVEIKLGYEKASDYYLVYTISSLEISKS